MASARIASQFHPSGGLGDTAHGAHDLLAELKTLDNPRGSARRLGQLGAHRDIGARPLMLQTR